MGIGSGAGVGIGSGAGVGVGSGCGMGSIRQPLSNTEDSKVIKMTADMTANFFINEIP